MGGGGGERGLNNFLHLKREGLCERGSLINNGFAIFSFPVTKYL